LNRQRTIQKFIAFLLLLLAVFGSTPKKYWHDLVADHTDYYSFYSGEKISLGQTGINCDSDDLVVSTPFIEASFNSETSFDVVYQTTYSFPYQFLHSSTPRTKDSRGPPSLA
jgi:hypothetical protein